MCRLKGGLFPFTWIVSCGQVSLQHQTKYLKDVISSKQAARKYNTLFGLKQIRRKIYDPCSRSLLFICNKERAKTSSFYTINTHIRSKIYWKVLVNNQLKTNITPATHNKQTPLSRLELPFTCPFKQLIHRIILFNIHI